MIDRNHSVLFFGHYVGTVDTQDLCDEVKESTCCEHHNPLAVAREEHLRNVVYGQQKETDNDGFKQDVHKNGFIYTREKKVVDKMDIEKQRIQRVLETFVGRRVDHFRVYVTRTKQDEYRATITTREPWQDSAIMVVKKTRNSLTTPFLLEDMLGEDGVDLLSDELMFAY